MKLPLSNRLLACCAFVNKGDRIADVGCDHGYLSIHLLTQGIARSAIASDVAEGPLLSALQKGNYVSVVSSSRIPDIITGAMGTHGYLLSPAAALAYGGLLDYRAKKGSMACALVICENSPVHDTGRLSGILGIPEQELKTMID